MQSEDLFGLDDCEHPILDTREHTPVCTRCGVPIINVEKDDSYFAGVSRCFSTEKPGKTLNNDLESLGLPKSVIDKANYYWETISKKTNSDGMDYSTFRKGNRKEKIAACVIESLVQEGVNFDKEKIAKMLNISEDSIKKGRKSITKNVTNVNITPLNFVPTMLKNFGCNEQLYDKIKILWNSIENRDISTFESRKPKSIAAGLIYFYIKYSQYKNKSKKPINANIFEEKVGVSANTFVKIAQDISTFIPGSEKVNF